MYPRSSNSCCARVRCITLFNFLLLTGDLGHYFFKSLSLLGNVSHSQPQIIHPFAVVLHSTWFPLSLSSGHSLKKTVTSSLRPFLICVCNTAHALPQALSVPLPRLQDLSWPDMLLTCFFACCLCPAPNTTWKEASWGCGVLPLVHCCIPKA